MLGRARQVVIKKDETIIVDGAGSEDDVKGRIKNIKNQLEESESEYDRENCRKEWLNYLVGSSNSGWCCN